MKNDVFFKMLKEMQKEELSVMISKGKEYTVSSDDKLANFKSIADRLNITPEIVCMCYLLKHMDSIRNYILTGKTYSDESIEGRILDARNYLPLLLAIIKDQEE